MATRRWESSRPWAPIKVAHYRRAKTGSLLRAFAKMTDPPLENASNTFGDANICIACIALASSSFTVPTPALPPSSAQVIGRQINLKTPT